MRAKNILFPTDFSETSEAALNFASRLAAESGAMLTIVHVTSDAPAYLAGYEGLAAAPDWSQQVLQENWLQLQEIKPTVPHVRHQYRNLRGVPEDQILTLAEQEGVDLIVIGSHGRTGLSRLLLGSVAEGVVRRAKCPVLTVKQPLTEPAEEEEESEKRPAYRKTIDVDPRSKHSLH